MEDTARMIQQLAIPGHKFLCLFDLLEFLYQIYSIKDVYGHYERKYDEMKLPSLDVRSHRAWQYLKQIQLIVKTY